MTTRTKRRPNSKTAQAIFSHAFQAGAQAAAQLVDVTSLVEAPSEPSVDVSAAVSALREYHEANELIKPLNRSKAKAKKVIDDLDAGVYGDYRLRLEPNADREEPDMEAIEALYAKLGMKVPTRMKQIAPSVKVDKV